MLEKNIFTFFSEIKLQKLRSVKKGEKKFFSIFFNFFPEMFFEKKIGTAEIPHPARQCK